MTYLQRRKTANTFLWRALSQTLEPLQVFYGKQDSKSHFGHCVRFQSQATPSKHIKYGPLGCFTLGALVFADVWARLNIFSLTSNEIAAAPPPLNIKLLSVFDQQDKWHWSTKHCRSPGGIPCSDWGVYIYCTFLSVCLRGPLSWPGAYSPCESSRDIFEGAYYRKHDTSSRHESVVWAASLRWLSMKPASAG